MRYSSLLPFTLVIFCTTLSIAQNSSYSLNKKKHPSHTDSFGSLSFGHNLTTNARTLKKGQTSLGSLFLAHGLTNNWSIGTSPFVMQNFEMFNLMTRYGLNISKTDRLGFDLAYFKTYGGEIENVPLCYTNTVTQKSDCSRSYRRLRGFFMEAVNLKVTYSKKIRPFYRFNTTASYFYYLDERMPFSFRMDPANDDPFTINLTTLHEFKLLSETFLNYEVGVWGFNYHYTYFHTGLSLNFQHENWLFGFGASTTFSPSFPSENAKAFAGYNSQASFHPELELQLFF